MGTLPDDDVVDIAETLVSLLVALPNVIRLSVDESRVESFDWNVKISFKIQWMWFGWISYHKIPSANIQNVGLTLEIPLVSAEVPQFWIDPPPPTLSESDISSSVKGKSLDENIWRSFYMYKVALRYTMQPKYGCHQELSSLFMFRTFTIHDFIFRLTRLRSLWTDFI